MKTTGWRHGRSRSLPGHSAGVAVDANGCPQKGSITLEGVTFEYNSANLQAGSLSDARRRGGRPEEASASEGGAAGSYRQQGAGCVQPHAVTEACRCRASLSCSRMAYRPRRLTAKGYGEGQPIADNNTEAGRAQNRRVVMFVIDNPGDVEVKGAGEGREQQARRPRAIAVGLFYSMNVSSTSPARSRPRYRENSNPSPPLPDNAPAAEEHRVAPLALAAA